MAVTDVSYFELHRSVVERIARENSQMSLALRNFFRERVVQNGLALLPVFCDLDAPTRVMLAQRFKTKHYRDGDELFYQGAPVCGVWMILEGSVDVGVDDEHGELNVHRSLPAGHFVGSVAALEGAVTDAAAVARGPVTTVALSHKAMLDLAQVHPGLRELTEPLRQSGLSITPRSFGGSAQLPHDLSPSFLQPAPHKP